MVTKRAIVAAMLCVGSSAFAATNLVLDGSFEGVAQADQTWNSYYGSSVPSWLAIDGPIEIRDNVAGTAESGLNFVELDSTHNSGMSQVLNTVAGQAYTLSFWFSSRAVSPAYNVGFPGAVVPASSNGLSVDVGTGATAVYTPTANTTSDNLWTLYTTTFTATGATTLTFTATGTSDSFGTSLDNISVTAVPEPASLSLMAGGLLLMAGLARRRHRQG